MIPSDLKYMALSSTTKPSNTTSSLLSNSNLIPIIRNTALSIENESSSVSREQSKIRYSSNLLGAEHVISTDISMNNSIDEALLIITKLMHLQVKKRS